MYPSEQFAEKLERLPEDRRKVVSTYIDESYHEGAYIGLVELHSWKELVEVLIDYETYQLVLAEAVRA